MRFELTTFSLARRRSTTELRPQVEKGFPFSGGRGERIRTSDLTVPIRVRYRTALRPDELN